MSIKHRAFTALAEVRKLNIADPFSQTIVSAINAAALGTVTGADAGKAPVHHLTWSEWRALVLLTDPSNYEPNTFAMLLGTSEQIRTAIDRIGVLYSGSSDLADELVDLEYRYLLARDAAIRAPTYGDLVRHDFWPPDAVGAFAIIGENGIEQLFNGLLPREFTVPPFPALYWSGEERLPHWFVWCKVDTSVYDHKITYLRDPDLTPIANNQNVIELRTEYQHCGRLTITDLSDVVQLSIYLFADDVITYDTILEFVNDPQSRFLAISDVDVIAASDHTEEHDRNMQLAREGGDAADAPASVWVSGASKNVLEQMPEAMFYRYGNLADENDVLPAMELKFRGSSNGSEGEWYLEVHFERLRDAQLATKRLNGSGYTPPGGTQHIIRVTTTEPPPITIR